MTEETQDAPDVIEGQQEQEVQQKYTPTPVEEEAMTQGWVPKDSFSGDEHKWVDAGEFLRRGELFKKIEDVSKQARHAKQTLEEFKAHYAKVKETEFQNALKTLRAERRQAIAEGDFATVEDIEERMESVKAEAETVKETAKTPEVTVHPDVAAWVENNPWYNSDSTMRAFADAIALNLNKDGFTGKALLKGIDDKVREAFPSKFKNPNRERPAAVESSATKSKAAPVDDFELTEQEKRIMNAFVRDKVMTKEQYIADLKKVKGVK